MENTDLRFNKEYAIFLLSVERRLLYRCLEEREEKTFIQNNDLSYFFFSDE